MKEIFPTISQIQYEGSDSTNPLSFRFYNPTQKVGDKTMAEHLRFSLAAWHTACNGLADPFGDPTIVYPWAGESVSQQAEAKQMAVCELAQKLQIPFMCFHGRDLFTAAPDFSIQEANYAKQAQILMNMMEDYGVKLGWGTENLFSDPKLWPQGSLNASQPWVAARAAAEIGLMIDMTQRLGGKNYVFWGGRVGYEDLMSDDVSLEQAVMASIYGTCIDYKKAYHPDLQLLEEPKGKEPTIFQYARDVATASNFLRANGFFDDFKFNIEGNHADLAGVTFHHEMYMARIAGGKIGGIDANSGVPQVGWDVDRYQESFRDALLGWLEVEKQGGLGTGVINHDAKPRRASTDIRQKVIGHIMAMDLWAKALLTVEKMRQDGTIDQIVYDKYADYEETELGREILEHKATMASLSNYTRKNMPKEISSGTHEETMWHLQRFLIPK